MIPRVTLKSGIDAKKTIVTYNSKEDRSKFNTIVFVLTKVHELLSKKLTVTRRYIEFDTSRFDLLISIYVTNSMLLLRVNFIFQRTFLPKRHSSKKSNKLGRGRKRRMLSTRNPAMESWDRSHG